MEPGGSLPCSLVPILSQIDPIHFDAGKEVGLEVNTEKTKYILLSRHQNAGPNHDIKIGKRCFENVEQFRYLGTTVTPLAFHVKFSRGERKKCGKCLIPFVVHFSSSARFVAGLT
jgi:hypothetical protein